MLNVVFYLRGAYWLRIIAVQDDTGVAVMLQVGGVYFCWVIPADVIEP